MIGCAINLAALRLVVKDGGAHLGPSRLCGGDDLLHGPSALPDFVNDENSATAKRIGGRHPEQCSLWPAATRVVVLGNSHKKIAQPHTVGEHCTGDESAATHRKDRLRLLSRRECTNLCGESLDRLVELTPTEVNCVSWWLHSHLLHVCERAVKLSDDVV